MKSVVRWASVFVLATIVPSIWAAELPPAVELLKLDGAALAKATNEIYFFGEKCPYNVDELIAIAAKLADDVKSFSDKPRYYVSPFGNFFFEACGRANESQLDQLIQIYVKLEPTSFEKMYDLPPLAAAWIHREVAAIRDKSIHAKLPEYGASPPRELIDAPKELIDAWHLYKGAMQASEKVLAEAPAKEQMSYELNMRSFFKLVDAVLLGQGKDSQETLLKFARTGANCMAMHDFEDAQSVAVLMVLLRERRLDEAVGAALRASSSETPLVTGSQKIDVVVELLQASGVDWESVVAGALVDRETREWGPDRKTFLRMLAGYGSDRAASFVDQIARWVKPEGRDAYVSVFLAFIDSNSSLRKCDGDPDSIIVYSSKNIDRISKVSVAKPLQTRFLSFLEESSNANSSEDFALAAVSTFARTQSQSSVRALRRLTLHRSRDVAESAARVLCAMGERIETAVNLAPVRFQVLVNGEPLPKDFNIAWKVSTQSGSVSSSTSVKDGGIAELERKNFNDPANPVTSVSLGSAYGRKANDLQFDIEVAAPTKLDAITQVDIPVSRMELILQNVEHLNAPVSKTCIMAMQQHKNREYDFFPHGADTFEAPPGATIVLPAVQNGVYDVLVILAGAEAWQGKVAVGPGTQPTEMWLKPGSDLRYKIFSPAGDSWYAGTLFKDGKELEVYPDSETEVYRGLPCGNYILHIPGSEDATRGKSTDRLKAGPDEIPYNARDISFTVTENSPPLIDLGEIHLEPLPK